MKKFLLLSLLSFSSLVMAQSVADKQLPAAITCVSEATSPAVKAFEITDLNTISPDSTINDTGLLDFEVKNEHLVNLSFSNECDNYYGLVFYKTDLTALKAGALLEIKGLLNYADVDLSDARGTENPTEETLTVTCRLK